MKKTILILLFLFSASLFGQGITVSLSVESNQISMNEQVLAKVKIEGSGDVSSWPMLAGVQAFEVQNGGTSSQIQIINGRMSRSRTFNIYLNPTRAGVFTIGPAKVEFQGQNYQSNSVRLVVSKVGTITKKEKNYFVEAVVDDKKPFIGQQINYFLRFYIRNIDRGNANVEFPDFSGDFWKENLKDNQREYQRNIDGIVWSVTEVKLALFPLHSGKIIINPAKLQVPIALPTKRQRSRSLLGSFFGEPRQTKVVNLQTNKLEIDVRDLPVQGKPQGFSGLVGDFTLKASLTKNSLAVGDSATLNLKVVGAGQIRSLKMPQINTDGFKIYEDKPQISVEEDDGQVIAMKEWNIALVPQKEGTHHLGPIDIWFFNPQQERYQKCSSGILEVQVTPGVGTEQLNHVATSSDVRKKKVNQLGEDLRPLKRDISLLKSDVVSSVTALFSFFSIVIMPLIYFLFVRLRARQLRLRSDNSLLKRERAYKNFTLGLKKIDSNKIYESCSKLLRTYIGDRLRVDGLALTPIEVEKLLSLNHVSLSLVKECVAYLKLCDMGTYGGQKTSMNEMLSRLSVLGRKLEKEIA